MAGGTKHHDKLTEFVTGASKVSAAKDVHVINIFRAIGSPNSSITIGKYKYYKWEYSRAIGVSTFFGGGSTTFYCHFSVETHNNKVKMLTWYGNQCTTFLDQINDYFKDNLNIVVITEEDKQRQSQIKSETANEPTLPLKEKDAETKDKISQ